MTNNKKYTSKHLKAAGVALFGPRWQTALARALGMRDGRRVRQWMTGDRPIPEGIWVDIISLLEARKISIDTVLEILNQK